jgi:DNA-binding XRE family transcriptional regulator
MRGHALRLDDVIAERCASDPEFRDYWERTALARAVAIAVIRYRSEHELSQRALARQLGMPYSQIARLEIGEHNPSIETLQRLAKGLGRRFFIAPREFRSCQTWYWETAAACLPQQDEL